MFTVMASFIQATRNLYGVETVGCMNLQENSRDLRNSLLRDRFNALSSVYKYKKENRNIPVGERCACIVHTFRLFVE